jgi:hypothetical protein
VQKNSQSLGGLFDLQPSEITGNIHGITHPAERVFGYVTAASVSEKRIFIGNQSLPGWKSNPLLSCPLDLAPVDPLNYQIYNYPDPSYGPYYFSAAGLVVAPRVCIDCRYQGGSTQKPTFWP